MHTHHHTALLIAERIDDESEPGRGTTLNGAEFLRRSRRHAPEAVRILLTRHADIGSTGAAPGHALHPGDRSP